MRDVGPSVLAYTPGEKRLVVTFDHVALAGASGPRWPWGYSFLRRPGWAVLGVMARQADWFRAPATIAAMEALRDEGLFQAHKRVSFYGTSMGGFGALTFGRLRPGATVVAVSPQSTLNADAAPFETRYGPARTRQDWAGPYRDGAEAVPLFRRGTIIYDPANALDAAHAARLTGPRMLHLRCRFLGHDMMNTLAGMGRMHPVLLNALRGELSPARAWHALRDRRDSGTYVARLIKLAEERGHTRLAARAAVQAAVHPGGPRLRRLAKRLEDVAP